MFSAKKNFYLIALLLTSFCATQCDCLCDCIDDSSQEDCTQTIAIPPCIYEARNALIFSNDTEYKKILSHWDGEKLDQLSSLLKDVELHLQEGSVPCNHKGELWYRFSDSTIEPSCYSIFFALGTWGITSVVYLSALVAAALNPILKNYVTMPDTNTLHKVDAALGVANATSLALIAGDLLAQYVKDKFMTRHVRERSKELLAYINLLRAGDSDN